MAAAHLLKLIYWLIINKVTLDYNPFHIYTFDLYIKDFAAKLFFHVSVEISHWLLKNSSISDSLSLIVISPCIVRKKMEFLISLLSL